MHNLQIKYRGHSALTEICKIYTYVQQIFFFENRQSTHKGISTTTPWTVIQSIKKKVQNHWKKMKKEKWESLHKDVNKEAYSLLQLTWELMYYGNFISVDTSTVTVQKRKKKERENFCAHTHIHTHTHTHTHTHVCLHACTFNPPPPASTHTHTVIHTHVGEGDVNAYADLKR